MALELIQNLKAILLPIVYVVHASAADQFAAYVHAPCVQCLAKKNMDSIFFLLLHKQPDCSNLSCLCVWCYRNLCWCRFDDAHGDRWKTRHCQGPTKTELSLHLEFF